MPDGRTTHVSLFGALDIRIGGESQCLGISGPTRSLLGYLFCFHTRLTRREQLVEMFWPNADEGRRRSSLNSAIWRIKKALKPYPALRIDASADWVRLTGTQAPGVEIDAMRVDKALRAMTGDGQQADDHLSCLLAALDDCEAEPLDGIDDDWALVERERLSALRMRALTAAMRELAVRKRYDDALEMGRRILVKEPYRECAFQEMMCLHILNGERARAIQMFDEFRVSLDAEMGIRPMAETRVLRDYLLGDGRRDRSSYATLAEPPARALIRPGVDELLSTIEHTRTAIRN
jgi:DNA-binding SARP family transcriptional activator